MMKSLYFNEEHALFRQSVSDFVTKEVLPHVNDWETKRQIPKKVWEKMGDLGFLGLMYPEKYGGMDANFFYSVVFIEEVSKGMMGGFAAAVNVHQYMATAHIASAGNDDLKKRYLKPAILGKKVAALAISEPNAGSDVSNLRTKAVKSGNYYTVNGAKTFITNGVYCDFITLACQTENGISLLVVDRNTVGITANKLDKMGWHSSDTAELFFDNVKVPTKNIIGEEGQGFYYIMDSFQLERLVAGIGSVAAAELALEHTLKYMNERKAFGRSISKFQVLRHDMANLATEIEAAKQFTYHTAWLFSEGIFCVKECSMVKLLTSELSKKVADVCLQCFGGYGYMEEYPIARMYRDARVGTIVGGTSQIMREIIAKIIVDEVSYKPAYKTTDNDVVPEKMITASANQTPTDKETATAEEIPENLKNPIIARDIIRSLAYRYRPHKAPNDYKTLVQFKITGPNGGNFTVEIEDGACFVNEGLYGEVKCIVTATDSNYEAVELGKTDPQMAVMMGKINLSNINEMMTFSSLFKRLY